MSFKDRPLRGVATHSSLDQSRYRSAKIARTAAWIPTHACAQRITKNRSRFWGALRLIPRRLGNRSSGNSGAAAWHRPGLLGGNRLDSQLAGHSRAILLVCAGEVVRNRILRRSDSSLGWIACWTKD